ncbi:MAG: ribosome-associated translation inhibitor RaiA [Chlamydiia bacterium]|nr:ribosome-associated translation inhibitor RaiA [Chlamydiia bacterium]
MNKSSKFENEGYTINVVSKHFQITDAIRNYVWEKLARVEKMADQIIEITVTLDTQKLEHTCSIFMNFIHFHIKVKASTDNIYSAIDKAADRVVRLVRRYKTKLQSHRAKHVSTVDIHVNVIQALNDNLKAINDDIEAENMREEQELLTLHQVVAKETMPLRTLTQDEAVMKMEIGDDPFILYRAEEDQQLKIIYRREDRNYGLVQVQ